MTPHTVSAQCENKQDEAPRKQREDLTNQVQST
jgi:hypothetical protein